MGAQPPLAAMRPLVMAARLTSNCGLRSLNHCWMTSPSGNRGLIERNAATVKAFAIAVSGVMKPASSMRSTAMILRPNDRDRNRHAHGFGFFDDRLDELSAFYRTQFRHRRPPSGAPLKAPLTRLLMLSKAFGTVWPRSV